MIFIAIMKVNDDIESLLIETKSNLFGEAEAIAKKTYPNGELIQITVYN